MEAAIKVLAIGVLFIVFLIVSGSLFGELCVTIDGAQHSFHVGAGRPLFMCHRVGAE